MGERRANWAEARAQGGLLTDPQIRPRSVWDTHHAVRCAFFWTLSVTVVLALSGLLAPTTGSAQVPAPSLKHACSPAPASCAAWYRSAVTLKWDYDNTTAHVSDGDCSNRTFSADTRGTVVYCEVADDMSGAAFGYPVTIRVDRTSPAVSAFPQRPPDYGGWFNHPVSISFSGNDATSGVSSCTSSAYGGPDGAGVQVTGSCQDVAGNVGTGSFAFNYDATPPPAPLVDSLPGDNRVALEWTASPDSQAEVVRGGKEVAPVVVYRGPGGAFTDRGLRNGQRYRYAVSLIDQAGNRAAGTTSAVPTSSKLLEPAKGERIRIVQLPLLIWKRVRKADYYNVQIFRGRRKVLSSWPRQPRFQVKRRWRYGGRQYRLVPGKYCWYVWPGHGRRAKRDYGKRLGKSCFRIVR
jgi:hypothetical protein